MKYILISTTLLLCIACNVQPKPIDIDIPEPPQKLVVSSYLVPPQDAVMTLSRTFSALFSEDTLQLGSGNSELTDQVLVKNGIVRIENEGNNSELYEITQGIYISTDVKHNFGTTYKLYAKDMETGEEVRAETQLLPQVEFDTIIAFSETLPSFGDTIHSFEIQFQDLVGQENYYLCSYLSPSDFAQAQSLTSVFSAGNSSYNVFSDASFGDGNPVAYTASFNGAVGDTIIVSLSNITRGYYEFLASYKRSGNLLNQLSGEPINLPTNVENGYGYFAMIRPKVGFVILK